MKIEQQCDKRLCSGWGLVGLSESKECENWFFKNGVITDSHIFAKQTTGPAPKHKCYETEQVEPLLYLGLADLQQKEQRNACG